MSSYLSDISELESQKSKYYALKERLRISKENQRKYQEASVKLQDLQYKSNVYKAYLQAIKEDINLAETEYIEYKEARIRFIEESINQKVMEIFPYDGFTIKLRFDNTRKEKIVFQLLDKYGKARSTKVSAGGLMRGLLAFSIAMDLSSSLGSKKAWTDEPFAASSTEKLEDIKHLIHYYLNQGFQIFMVEHKSEAYKDLPRREFKLSKDPSTGGIAKIEYIDYEEEGGSL